MLLAINIRNYEIDFGVYDKEELKFVASLLTENNGTSHESAIKILNILELYEIDKKEIDSCIIASVSPQTTEILQEAVFILFKIKAIIVGVGTKTGLKIKADNPPEIGGNIVAASVGAISKYKSPLVIILFGTAITFVVIDESDAFIGASIYPGVSVAMNALFKHTKLLPQTSVKKAKQIIGKNNFESIESGVFFGTISMLNGMIKKIWQELGVETEVIISGESGKIFCDELDYKVVYDNNIILDGLKILFDKRFKKIKK